MSYHLIIQHVYDFFPAADAIIPGEKLASTNSGNHSLTDICTEHSLVTLHTTLQILTEPHQTKIFIQSLENFQITDHIYLEKYRNGSIQSSNI